MKLVPDWRDSWKWFSVHVAALQAVIASVQAAFATYAQPVLSPKAFAFCMIGFAVLVPLARLINQPGKQDVADS